MAGNRGRSGSRSVRSANQRGATNLRGFYVLLATIAVGGLGWISWSVSHQAHTATKPIQLDIKDSQALYEQAKGEHQGKEDAPVQVLLFSAFTCPHCAEFSSLIEPQLKADFIDTGKARLVYYDFPLGETGPHRYGFIAARAARCAGDQNKFWEYHDVLLGRQSDWVANRSMPTAKFNDYAKLVGLDLKQFDQCLNSDKYADVVTADRMLGEKLGVPGTPTVFIGSRSIEYWSSYDSVKAAINRELGGSGGN